MGSIRARLLLSYLLLIGLVLFLVGASLVFFLSQTPVLDRLATARLASRAEAIAERGSLDALRPAREAALAQRLDRQTLARVLVLDEDGRVLVDSRPEAAALELDALAARGQAGDVLGDRWNYASQILDEDRVLVLASPTSQLRLAVLGDDLLRALGRAGLVAAILSVVLAALLGRWLGEPLRRMVPAARTLAAGEFRQPIPVEGPDEVRELALALNEMADRVQASQQMQRDFVANVSHELKTPLTSIQGFAQAIADGTADDPGSRQHATQVILEESGRLRRLVDDLLSLARMDAGQVAYDRQPVDLVPILRAVVDRASVAAAARQAVVHTQLRPCPLVRGDGDWLAQVFTNLVDNALQSLTVGGEVRLTCGGEGGWAVVDVIDNGPGIPADEVGRVFERFYQVDKSRKAGPGRGSGLGLAISSEIVHAHGGSLSVESRLGIGSRFKVRLPSMDSEDSTAARRRPR
ncbi:MAG: HAMP domain-containing histidine kinase [Anaerolineales bacterium]|nr:HAMP domain-containing histidine kinase [Anaerolineales bacterium]